MLGTVLRVHGEYCPYRLSHTDWSGLPQVLSEASFAAPESSAKARADGHALSELMIDREYVEARIQPLLKKQDLSRYML